MKTLHCRFQVGLCLLSTLAGLTGGVKVLAQTASSGSNSVPVVTIQATEPVATGPGNPGVFTVFRDGNTNVALNVFYEIGGTASNGVDYATISQWVAIPAGAMSNDIIITPIKSQSSVVKTVVLQLAQPPTLNPVNFEIGVPSNAVVYLAATNFPPLVVSMVEPRYGAVFYTPTNLQLVAKANDPTGSVTKVEFFAGTENLGPGNPVVLDPPGIGGVTGLVYLFNWLNVPVGGYSLTAVATDNGGLSAISPAVNITVLPGPPNQPLAGGANHQSAQWRGFPCAAGPSPVCLCQ